MFRHRSGTVPVVVRDGQVAVHLHLHAVALCLRDAACVVTAVSAGVARV